MAASILVRLLVTDDDDGTTLDRREITAEIASPVIKIERASLSNGFNALTVPSGATLLVIEPLTGAVTWTLKGVTGDTGNVLAAASTLPTKPIMVPLGTSPSVGINVGGAATANLYWL